MISKSTIESDIYSLIYSRMRNTITSVTLSDSSVVGVQTYTSTFPDYEQDSESDYPVLVVNPIEMKWTQFTITRKQVEGTFLIDLYATKAEAADKLRQAIIESIETYRPDLKELGMDFVMLDGVENDDATRGAFKVHVRSCRFNFMWRFTETRV